MSDNVPKHGQAFSSKADDQMETVKVQLRGMKLNSCKQRILNYAGLVLVGFALVCSTVAKPELSGTGFGLSTSGTPLHGRIIYFVTTMVALMSLTYMMYSRWNMIKGYGWRSITAMRAIVLAIYVTGFCFLISAETLLMVVDTTSDPRCYLAIIICLIFYVGTKVLDYFFLAERNHLLGTKDRMHDYFWLGSVAVIVLGFGIIAVIAFMHPVTGVSTIDHVCRIGLPLEVTIPLLSYDVLINLVLTVAFFYMALPHFEGNSFKDFLQGLWGALPGRKLPSEQAKEAPALIKYMACRGVLGSLIIVLPTIANLVLLFFVHGREQSWLCFTICTIDITMSNWVIHWFTSTAEDMTPIRAARAARPRNEPGFIEMV